MRARFPLSPTSLRRCASPGRESTLYFAANISDDVLVGNNSSQIWGDDTVELGIRVGTTTHQFSVAVDGRQADQGSPITSLSVATRTVSGGWTLEVGIPAAAVGLSQFSVDQIYPFTFGLWDDDLFSYPGQTHMIWQGTSTNTFHSDWGTLQLTGAVFNFAPAKYRYADPDEHLYRKSNAHPHRDAYADIDANRDPNAHIHAHAHRYQHVHRDPDGHGHAHAHAHTKTVRTAHSVLNANVLRRRKAPWKQHDRHKHPIGGSS